MLIEHKFLENLGQVLSKYPDADLKDLFSKGQLRSKRWLISKLLELDLDLGNVFLCAGWYGALASYMFDANLKINFIRSFDIDESCADIADTLNRDWVINKWKFKASTLDISLMHYPLTYTTLRVDGLSKTLTEMPDTIINTSCEHIKNFNSWYENIPLNTLLVLQTNNFYEITDHVNCSESVEDFDKSTPMKTTMYLGEISLPTYKRFMKIGIK